MHHFVPHRNTQIEQHADFCTRQGAALHVHGERFQKEIGAALAAVQSHFDSHDPSTYFVSPGGSNVLGAVGHAEAAVELVEQSRRGLIPLPDTIVVGVGTCGTIAGLLAGLRIAGVRTRVVGIRCVDGIIANRFNIRRLANSVLQMAGVSSRIGLNEIDLRSPSDLAYAKEQVDANELSATFKLLENLTLDTTYTTKVASGLRAVVQEASSNSKNILYWHTYGGAELASI